MIIQKNNKLKQHSSLVVFETDKLQFQTDAIFAKHACPLKIYVEQTCLLKIIKQRKKSLKFFQNYLRIKNKKHIVRQRCLTILSISLSPYSLCSPCFTKHVSMLSHSTLRSSLEGIFFFILISGRQVLTSTSSNPSFIGQRSC